MKNLLSMYSPNNTEVIEAVNKWAGYASGQYDARSGTIAVELFSDVALSSDEGRVALVLAFQDLFNEFGELPCRGLFEEVIVKKMNVLHDSLGDCEEKEVVEWFLSVVNN